MTSGIHLPLGKDKKPPRQRKNRLTAGRALSLVAILALGGLSGYAYLRPDNLERPVPAASEQKNGEEPAADPAIDVAAADKQAEQQDKLRRSRPKDGATIERQVMDDGHVVTKYSPKRRDGEGPVIIDADASNPQSRDEAAYPDDALLEDGPEGRLPIVAADGTRPFDRYARPWSGARGTRIAIVISGLGLSQTGTQRALRTLPEEITVAFAANGNSLSRWMPEARQGGHEVLLQVPLEPFNYPDNDPGPLTLLTGSSPEKNLDRLYRSMGKMTNYTGIMNYLGGRFLADPAALEPVMRDIGNRGLLFLDDGSSAQSLSATYAKAFTMPHAFADLVIDENVSKGEILAKLDELERIAARNGTAIGVGSAFDETVDAVTEWAGEASRRGIEIVGVSALADVPN
ncbi:divergent polysaccharide deacetylase family protein [Rhizobium alvei]|uniref:Divergent polysaccharide deacetylase family protein n=1 Tax=Rhizobium alvei TaxID=1132659 RepID=A0ABT8YTG8_9HYPH|nr:divergent polysaccharide deacetylase family protein [Rhizobium alvei]MDO6967063.1 divergent polysaccharide deacetylase family protein [Rhizobium alvei]